MLRLLTFFLVFFVVSLGWASSEASDKPGLFSLDPGVGIWAILVFVFLLLILTKFAWGPILASIEEREKTIRDSLDKAREAQNQSKLIANEQNRLLSEARAEASDIIQKAKEAAEEMASKIKSVAMDDKARIVQSGVMEIEAAKAVALSQLKSETANLSLQIAAKLVRQSFDPEKHREYLNSILSEIERETTT